MSQVLASFVPRQGIQVGLFLGLVMFTVAAAGALLTVDQVEHHQGFGVGRLVLWVVLVLCPVFAVDVLVRLKRRTPILVATTEGLMMRSIFGFTAPIPWDRIAAFRPEVISKKIYLAIFLVDPRKTLAGYSMTMRLMHIRSHDAGVPNITLRAFQLGANPVEAAEVLERIRLERESV